MIGFNERGMEKRVFEVPHTCSWHEMLCHLLCIMKNVLIAGTGRAAQCSCLLLFLFSPHIWDSFWACSSIYFQNANMPNEALCFEPPRSSSSSSSVHVLSHELSLSWPMQPSVLLSGIALVFPAIKPIFYHSSTLLVTGLVLWLSSAGVCVGRC